MTSSQKKPMTLKSIAALAGAGLLYLIAQVTGIDFGLGKDGDQSTEAPKEREVAPKEPAIETPAPEEAERAENEKPKRNDLDKVRQLFRAGRSDVQVEVEGEVVHILPDDNEGSRHQLFLLKLSNGITLKISHNIDIAPYIETLARGDTVRVYGEYEWNEKGGVVHWTHRNTRGGRHPGGWILHEGTKYQ